MQYSIATEAESEDGLTSLQRRIGNLRRSLQGNPSHRECFPECVGMQVEDCSDFIESLAADAFTVVNYPEGYEYSRINMKTDEFDNVYEAPYRG